MVGGGKQTTQIIEAANKSKDAAEKSAQAARDFADTAADINDGIHDAVTKLNIQASSTHDLALQAKRSADAALKQTKLTDKLAENTSRTADYQLSTLVAAAHSGRAWLGITEGRLIQFEAGKPWKINVRVGNSGRTPTLHSLYGTKGLGVFPNFRQNDTRQSLVFIGGIEHGFDTLDMGPFSDIPPGGFVQVDGAGKIVEESTFNQVKRGFGSYVIIGMFDYFDDSDRKQWTKFCFEISIINEEKILSNCPFGNELSYQNETAQPSQPPPPHILTRKR
ncbi:MAG TPA: hypothetical protein VGU67_06400 [Edaphobacter sp.]|nr:hypothetical protein [Edaphobacter sp.]